MIIMDLNILCVLCLLFCVRVRCQYANISATPENFISNPCTDRNHLFLAPGVLTAGGTNRACVSRFYPEGPARMLITLVAEDGQMITASRELPPGDGGCVDISVPQLPNTKADLIVNIWYGEAACAWERRVGVRVASGRVVVVQAERARYRPGDKLSFRVFAFKPDLTPAHAYIDEIWVEGPRGAWEGSRVAQWTRVRTRLGLAQLQYDLDELAPSGTWTVRASLGDGSQGSAVFWVGNYELPPFQLSVRHAPRVLRTSERLVWTVCVRYPWSEAVEGMLVIRLRGAGNSDTSSVGIRTAVRLQAPRACHRHAAASRRIGLDGANPPDVVIADFSFQEEGTRIWQNTTVVSQVVDKPISLEFLTKNRAVISPGLPYKLKVKATRWDDKPASDERIRVCRYPASQADLSRATPTAPSQSDATCVAGDTDAGGVARIMFAAGDDASPFYRFEASLSNDSSTTASPLTLPVRRSALTHAALGPLKADSLVSRTFVPLYLHLPNFTHAVTVHFVVITRGGIIYRWGATTQCPIANSANQVQTASRNSKCTDPNYPQNNINFGLYNTDTAQFNTENARYNTVNTLYNKNTAQKVSNITQDDINVSDALLDRHLLRVMLPIKVTHQMCPDSHLIAYFYYNGELVTASKHFEMEECFVNKVEATWLSRQTLPGSIASLQVSTPGPALCALTALDTAAKWSQPPQTMKEVLMASLKRLIDGHRNLTEYDAAGDCFLNVDTPELPPNSLELTATWLAAAGVRVLGGDVPTKRHCTPSPAALVSVDEKPVPRSDFSEAWLWRLLAIGANGSAVASGRAPDSITRFEASALCVSKTGFAISPPAVLQVFREFFIHADSPRRLRRGDTTIIRYRIFNYLYEPLNVQIQVRTDHQLESSEATQTACIKARAALARRLEVAARGAGQARLHLRADVIAEGSCGGTARNVSDEVVIQITVEPEGVPVQEHKSILLCGADSRESGESTVSWSWPRVQAVPGTESLTVWAAGDATGPLLADADALVLLPRGCGEQNMARLATNLLALSQLDPRSPAAAAAKEHVARGFTRQLQYVHPTGGFSAFGSSDATSSTWLTAFALRYLRRAHQVLWPGLPSPPALDRAERWLLSQQMENGCFRNEGQVFHRELRGGLNEGEIASVALTAYVITSLVESTSPLSSRVLRNTLTCLRALPPLKSQTPARVYGHALLAYAFMRLRRYEEELRKTNEASLLWARRKAIGGGMEKDEELREVMDLLKMARKSGDYVWWETSSLSTSIEATSYALLALRESPAALRAAGGGALRWLAAQRGATGGFVATQDTLVALEALVSWSSIQARGPGNLTVWARSGGVARSARLQRAGRIPDLMLMGSGDQLDVAVEGTGCALIQATRSYNTLSADATSDKLLLAQVTVHTEGPFDCDANGTYCFCAAVVEVCVVWGGGFPAMAVVEAALPGGYAADAARLLAHLQRPGTLLRRIELAPSSSKATLYLGSRDGSAAGGRGGHECYALHAVGPAARTRPAYVRVQDYYTPAVNDTQVYTIPEDCPPRISHEANEYQTSDNLFNKARSLSDSNEIVITNEFSFEDIPEGIPLEDPLYENLTRREKDKSGMMDKINKIKTTEEANSIVRENILKTKIVSILEEHKESNVINHDTLPNAHENKDNNTVHERTLGSNKLNPENKPTNMSPIELNEKPIAHNNSLKEFDHNLDTNKEVNIKKGSKFDTKYEDKDNATDKNITEENKKESDITPSHVEITTEHSNQIDPNTNDTDEVQADKHRIEIREEHENTENKGIDNPTLSDFHVIDSEKDLEVPSGMEGPIPAVVLPPQDFVRPPQSLVMLPRNNVYFRGLQGYSRGMYFFPINHDNLSKDRRNNAPTG